ncbi:MAG: CDP-diacylglycerol--serine O-phosphatidyltransferase [Pelagibacteraceae bacterium]|jgi:CDP-diacylglycerol--serine O-phosphatidyltransferase|nr:CDP-diacylglycerol--serine O-phosphatidyltransferase [Pelagibacteraceae bacterium]|tara:strand:+ start:1155 stop:1877 length:723 start_codon:yes stop_codon:yes gene_type:complete
MAEHPLTKFIPNLITLMSLIAGISSIKFSIQANWKLAVLMIMLAAFFDFFDGWMARKLKKSSQFGAELDSLSDFISFGLAPSLLINLCFTHELGRIGWVISLFYIVCAALRLARFNIENMKEQSKVFYGIPSPAAAGVIMIPLYLNFIDQVQFTINYPLICAVLTTFAGIMMISRVPTPSVKNLKVKTLYFRLMIISVAIVLIFLISYFWQTTLLVAIAYLLISLLSLLTYFFTFFRRVS